MESTTNSRLNLTPLDSSEENLSIYEDIDDLREHLDMAGEFAVLAKKVSQAHQALLQELPTVQWLHCSLLQELPMVQALR